MSGLKHVASVVTLASVNCTSNWRNNAARLDHLEGDTLVTAATTEGHKCRRVSGWEAIATFSGLPVGNFIVQAVMIDSLATVVVVKSSLIIVCCWGPCNWFTAAVATIVAEPVSLAAAKAAVVESAH